jgi:hypothetical protein
MWSKQHRTIFPSLWGGSLAVHTMRLRLLLPPTPWLVCRPARAPRPVNPTPIPTPTPWRVCHLAPAPRPVHPTTILAPWPDHPTLILALAPPPIFVPCTTAASPALVMAWCTRQWYFGGYMVWTILTSSSTTVEHFLQEVYPHEDRKHLLVSLDTEGYRVIGWSKMTLMYICVSNQCLLFQPHRQHPRWPQALP